MGALTVGQPGFAYDWPGGHDHFIDDPTTPEWQDELDAVAESVRVQREQGVRTASWDEGLHPRDERGRFGDKGEEDRPQAPGVDAAGWTRDVAHTDSAEEMWAALHKDDGVPFPEGRPGQELRDAMPARDFERYTMVQSNGEPVSIEFMRGTQTYYRVEGTPPFLPLDQKQAVLEFTAKLVDEFPSPHGATISFTQGLNVGDTTGTTIRAGAAGGWPETAQVSIADRVVQYFQGGTAPETPWHADVPDGVTGSQYTLAHEWGHVIDDGSVHVSVPMTGYSESSGNAVEERYAEAFAAYYFNREDSTPTVLDVAKEAGWST